MAMTSIYYTECGHWGRRDLSGSSRSRERYTESLGEGELCPDCKREALLKKREAEQAEAVPDPLLPLHADHAAARQRQGQGHE